MTREPRSAFESVIAAGPDNPFARAGRLNRAKLDIDAGAIDRAWAEYDALLAKDPRDAPARLSRALLALRFGPAAQCEADLTILLQRSPSRPTNYSRAAPWPGWHSAGWKTRRRTPQAPTDASPARAANGSGSGRCSLSAGSRSFSGSAVPMT